MSSFRFEHNLTRPYPFKWYTPAVLAGFTIATILFSVLNYASNGYTLQAAYLSDPRPTSWPGMDSWYRNWPASLVGGNKPSCQPASIPIGSTLFTNNSALPWTVDDVGLLSNGTIQATPSLVYQGEKLTDCELLMITLSTSVPVEPGDPTGSSGWWQTKLEGKVCCRVHTPSLGSIQLNLTSTWSQTKYEMRDRMLQPTIRRFLGRDDTYLSLAWAEDLIALSYSGFVNKLVGIGLREVNYTGVSMRFMSDSKWTTPDIRSRQYFSIGVEVRGNSYQSDEPQWIKLNQSQGFLVEDAVAMNLTPNIWTQADDISKVFLSTMLTDLGQVSATPNILSDPELLEIFTEGDFKASPENDTLLGVRPSVLATNYLCQVPRRKPWGSLIISILVADLVLLRALWTVVTFVSTYFAKQRDPLANTCETCARSLREVAESSDEQSSPAGGSALELERLNGGSTRSGLSRSSSLNESLGSRSGR